MNEYNTRLDWDVLRSKSRVNLVGTLGFPSAGRLRPAFRRIRKLLSNITIGQDYNGDGVNNDRPHSRLPAPVSAVSPPHPISDVRHSAIST